MSWNWDWTWWFIEARHVCPRRVWPTLESFTDFKLSHKHQSKPMRIMEKDAAFPEQLLCRKRIARAGVLSWQNVVRSKGFSFLRREASNSPHSPKWRRNVTLLAYFWLFFLTSILLWHLSKKRTVSTLIFCSSCFAAKDE